MVGDSLTNLQRRRRKLKRKLNIKGEDLIGVESSREVLLFLIKNQFVNWYNGTPNEDNNKWFNKATEKYKNYFKDTKNVIIIGNTFNY